MFCALLLAALPPDPMIIPANTPRSTVSTPEKGMPANTPPFRAIPNPTPVPLASSSALTTSGSTRKPEDKVPPYSFESAAHFPMIAWDRDGCSHGERHEANALLIYEGMTFELIKDGKFAVHFTTTIPDQPVVLHMQLQVQSMLPQGIPAKTVTITLPPIRLKPRSGADLGMLNFDTNLGDGNTFEVTHEGFSRALVDHHFETAWCLKVERTNSTARFERAAPKLFDASTFTSP
jgi:hypothetical protein